MEEERQPRGCWWFCCRVPRRQRSRERKPKKVKRDRSRRSGPRRHRSSRSHRIASPAGSRLTTRSELGHTSILSDDDWHDAQDAFSSLDSEGHSVGSIPTVGSPRGSAYLDGAGHPESPGAHERRRSGSRGASGSMDDALSDEYEGESDISEGDEEESVSPGGLGARLVSCLAIMRHDLSVTGDEPAVKSPRGAVARGPRPPAGCTLPRRQPGDDPSEASRCWDECDATTYQIRSVDYMKTKLKVSSSKAIYRLVGVDIFRADAKAFHVSRLVHLPSARDAVRVGDVALPPLLVFNIQLPQYAASFFGASDGLGQSIVYYFALPEDFDPSRFENKAALGLLARFVSNGREADGAPTRERLKMIARVANVDEWAAHAPLSTAEYKLLASYNEKPVLTRPQHFFFVGPNYLEVDMDVHSYAFLARKALNSYHARLKSVVWENAFVLQGNAPDELPEQVLGCGRIYRTDFEEARPLSDYAFASASGANSSLQSRTGSTQPSSDAPLGGSGGGGAAAVAAAAAAAAAAVRQGAASPAVPATPRGGGVGSGSGLGGGSGGGGGGDGGGSFGAAGSSKGPGPTAAAAAAAATAGHLAEAAAAAAAARSTAEHSAQRPVVSAQAGG